MDGRRRKVEHTDDWQELLSLFDWPEQEAYEELRPLALQQALFPYLDAL
jgi:hypothetical protein